MIANQLVTCEECRDASCRECKAYIKRARARKAKPVARTVEQACADAMAEAAAIGLKLRSCKPF